MESEYFSLEGHSCAYIDSVGESAGPVFYNAENLASGSLCVALILRIDAALLAAPRQYNTARTRERSSAEPGCTETGPNKRFRRYLDDVHCNFVP